MSEPSSRKDLPREMARAQALQQEISRNSQEISFNFWQEFERIRATQLQRLMQERQERERINTMMVAADAEAHQLTEALSRSMVSQGTSLEAMPLPATTQEHGSVCKIPTQETSQFLQRPLRTGLRNAVSSPIPQKPRAQIQRFQMANKSKAPAKPNSKAVAKPAPARAPSSRIASAPVTNRTTKISTNPSKGAKLSSSKTTPDVSKLRQRRISKTSTA
ncbi:uncharacterized protein LOC111079111 [Drosophila obscura]|uniref:uncharacterized protein LOC111079111 n=1 Tax=Drosophila obscura TaxID=7282 RepID=UPI001BB16857|nr:uncharacterized protein LOC111079111 [Drosophila obscura]